MTDIDGFEEAKEELDEKDLLLRQTFALERCLVELQQIRMALTSGKPEDNESMDWYQCKSCLNKFAEDELEAHARKCVGWMDGLGDVYDEFEKVD